jgi:hypothetical protein
MAHEHGVQAIDDTGCRSGRCDHAPDRVRIDCGEPLLRERRHVRKARESFRRGRPEHAQAAGFSKRRNRSGRRERIRNLAGDQLGDGWTAALVRHVDGVDAGGEPELLEREMDGRPIARGTEGELARTCLGECDQLVLVVAWTDG